MGGLATHLIDGRQVMLQLVQHTHQLFDLLGLLLGACGLIVELGGRLRNGFNLLIKIRCLLWLLHQIKVLLLLHIHPGWVGLGGKILGGGRLDLCRLAKSIHADAHRSWLLNHLLLGLLRLLELSHLGQQLGDQTLLGRPAN